MILHIHSAIKSIALSSSSNLIRTFQRSYGLWVGLWLKKERLRSFLEREEEYYANIKLQLENSLKELTLTAKTEFKAKLLAEKIDVEQQAIRKINEKTFDEAFPLLFNEELFDGNEKDKDMQLEK